MTNRGERGIWQRRYWEHTILDDRDFAAHMDYRPQVEVECATLLRLLLGDPEGWHTRFRLLCYNKVVQKRGCDAGGGAQIG